MPYINGCHDKAFIDEINGSILLHYSAEVGTIIWVTGQNGCGWNGTDKMACAGSSIPLLSQWSILHFPSYSSKIYKFLPTSSKFINVLLVQFKFFAWFA